MFGTDGWPALLSKMDSNLSARRPIVVFLLATLVVGCREQPSTERIDGNEVTTPATPQADLDASLESIAQGPGEAADANGADAEEEEETDPNGRTEVPRFVGRWAAEERLCATAAWRFTGNELRTPAGSVCRFERVRAVPGGYDIDARCTAERPPTDDRLEIRFAESAGAMLFESDVIADAGLISCNGE